MSDVGFSLPKEVRAGNVDEIHEQMIANAPKNLDKAEGGVFWDFTRPTAVGIAEGIGMDLSEGIRCIFPQFSEGVYLDYHGKTRGMVRKEASFATVDVTFSGVPDTEIPKGFVVATEATAASESIEFETTLDAIIPTGGQIVIPCKAKIGGVVGNVVAKTIIVTAVPLEGVESCINMDSATGGTDAEGDDSFRERITEFDANRGLSFVGSDADYKRWAEDVDGVGNAVVIPAEDTTGVVTIIITDLNGEAGNEELCQKVYNYIMSPDDRSKRLAPINAKLVVNQSSYINIDIYATVELEEGYTIDLIIKPFLDNLRSLYNDAVKIREVRLSAIYGVFSKTAGVKDCGDITINGKLKNVAIPIGTLPLTTVSGLHFTSGDIPDDMGGDS